MHSKSTDELRARIADLEAENSSLTEEAKSIANANVNAALKLVELAEIRRAESETREEELKEALVRAEAASRKKDEFLAKVSHELRTPLHAILGMSALLLDGKLPPEEREFAETTQQSAQSLALLIDDLLDIGRIESARIELDRIEFKLWQVCEEVVRPLDLLKNAGCQARALHRSQDPAASSWRPGTLSPSSLKSRPERLEVHRGRASGLPRSPYRRTDPH